MSGAFVKLSRVQQERGNNYLKEYNTNNKYLLPFDKKLNSILQEVANKEIKNGISREEAKMMASLVTQRLCYAEIVIFFDIFFEEDSLDAVHTCITLLKELQAIKQLHEE
jgi:hypothetical protein